ncbi:MAG: hypothetical protein WD066_17520 [Planctomycetaceae bacterium]
MGATVPSAAKPQSNGEFCFPWLRLCCAATFCSEKNRTEERQGREDERADAGPKMLHPSFLQIIFFGSSNFPSPFGCGCAALRPTRKPKKSAFDTTPKARKPKKSAFDTTPNRDCGAQTEESAA